MNIRIADYGVGNLHSALKAFKLFAPSAEMSEDPSELQSADAIILPGVGAFEAGMRGLKERNLIDVIVESASAGKPIMGICLGAQLLMSTSFEFGEHEGLHLIEGEVKHFPDIGERIPHIGWNEIEKDTSWESTPFEGIGDSPEMYFVHSYYMEPLSNEQSLATTTYGDFRFTSVIRNENIYGCQFHPEKSGKAGLKLIENFVRLVEQA